MELLSERNIKVQIKKLSGWKISGRKITKTYIKKDFSAALVFVVQIGIESEKLDHHPDLFLHSWNKVKVSLSTHSEGGITMKDIELAKLVEEI